MSSIKSNLFMLITTLAIAIWAIVGYVMNFVALIGMTSSDAIGMIIGRIIGVVVPFVGAVLGYL